MQWSGARRGRDQTCDKWQEKKITLAHAMPPRPASANTTIGGKSSPYAIERKSTQGEASSRALAGLRLLMALVQWRSLLSLPSPRSVRHPDPHDLPPHCGQTSDPIIRRGRPRSEIATRCCPFDAQPPGIAINVLVLSLDMCITHSTLTQLKANSTVNSLATLSLGPICHSYRQSRAGLRRLS